MTFHEIKLLSRKIEKNYMHLEKSFYQKKRYRTLDGFKFQRHYPIVLSGQGNQKVIDQVRVPNSFEKCSPVLDQNAQKYCIFMHIKTTDF